MSLNATAKVETQPSPVVESNDAPTWQPFSNHAKPTTPSSGGFSKGTPSSNLKWLEKANNAPRGFNNYQIRDQIQSVQDYCMVARSSEDSNRSHDAMEKAGVAMKNLDVLNRDPKISKHDRAAIAATKKIYDRHQKLDWGQTHDPDIHLIKMSHDRHAKNGGKVGGRLPANSQLAKHEKSEENKSSHPHHPTPAHRKDETMLAKGKKFPTHHAAPKSIHAANPHHPPHHMPQKIGVVKPKHGPKEIHEAPNAHGPQKIGTMKPKHGPKEIHNAPHNHGPQKIGSVKPKHGPVEIDPAHPPKTPKRLG